MKVDLEEAEKSALVWEVHEKAIELFVRRWKFRFGLAIAVLFVLLAFFGWRLGPWMQQQARQALDERIEEMAQLETETIKRIKQEQAIALQGIVVQLEETKRTTEATLETAKDLSIKVEGEKNKIDNTQAEVNSLVDAVELLNNRRDQLPILASALAGIDEGKLNIEARLQSAEQRLKVVETPLSESCRFVFGKTVTDNSWAKSSKAQCEANETAMGGGCSASSALTGSIGRMLNNSLSGYECVTSNIAHGGRVTAQAVCCI